MQCPSADSVPASPFAHPTLEALRYRLASRAATIAGITRPCSRSLTTGEHPCAARRAQADQGREAVLEARDAREPQRGRAGSARPASRHPSPGGGAIPTPGPAVGSMDNGSPARLLRFWQLLVPRARRLARASRLPDPPVSSPAGGGSRRARHAVKRRRSLAVGAPGPASRNKRTSKSYARHCRFCLDAIARAGPNLAYCLARVLRGRELLVRVSCYRVVIEDFLGTALLLPGLSAVSWRFRLSRCFSRHQRRGPRRAPVEASPMSWLGHGQNEINPCVGKSEVLGSHHEMERGATSTGPMGRVLKSLGLVAVALALAASPALAAKYRTSPEEGRKYATKAHEVLPRGREPNVHASGLLANRP